jgi:hypothetical protein
VPSYFVAILKGTHPSPSRWAKHMVNWLFRWSGCTSKLLEFCVFHLRLFQGRNVGVGAFAKCEPMQRLRMPALLTA